MSQDPGSAGSREIEPAGKKRTEPRIHTTPMLEISKGFRSAKAASTPSCLRIESGEAVSQRVSRLVSRQFILATRPAGLEIPHTPRQRRVTEL